MLYWEIQYRTGEQYERNRYYSPSLCLYLPRIG